MSNAPPSPRTSARRRRASPAQVALLDLFRAADRVKGSFETLFEPHGITGQQYNVLRILRGAEPDGLPTLTIAARMIERAPGVTRMIDRLETKGLVSRERGRGDRRCVHCRVTRRGLELLRRLDRPVDKGEWAVVASLTPEELARLSALLQRVLARPGPAPKT